MLLNFRFEGYMVKVFLNWYNLVAWFVRGFLHAADDVRCIVVADFVTRKNSFKVYLGKVDRDVIDKLFSFPCWFGDVLLQSQIFKGVYILVVKSRVFIRLMLKSPVKMIGPVQMVSISDSSLFRHVLS